VAVSSATRARRLLTLFGVGGAVVVADQWTKDLVLHAAEAGQLPFHLIPGVLDVRLVFNTGAAFSIGAGGGATLLFTVLAVLICVGIGLWFWFDDELPRAAILGLSAVAGGGIGNMIDRVVSGQVTDFLATTFVDFPVFNVADIAVTCGVAVSLAVILLSSRKAGQAR
jgi:signal peptidase II